MTAPDPVNEAKAYQDMLLAALGDDDPAEVQAGTPDRVRRLLTAAGDDLRTRPAPREWSVLECVGHIVDAETVMSARYRWVLAHDEPELIGYDQDLWVDGLRHNDDDPDELLTLFSTLRMANLALWRRSSSVERARVGMHRERGRESYELMFRLLAGHDRIHLAQAERALATSEARGAS
ncbi:MAG TPA: DinB family protein [Candidatus Limnocylindrales bacterium]|nr:DinB family protein [Candidatus Limnocylindrales bacterium]